MFVTTCTAAKKRMFVTVWMQLKNEVFHRMDAAKKRMFVTTCTAAKKRMFVTTCIAAKKRMFVTTCTAAKKKKQKFVSACTTE